MYPTRKKRKATEPEPAIEVPEGYFDAITLECRDPPQADTRPTPSEQGPWSYVQWPTERHEVSLEEAAEQASAFRFPDGYIGLEGVGTYPVVPHSDEDFPEAHWMQPVNYFPSTPYPCVFDPTEGQVPETISYPSDTPYPPPYNVTGDQAAETVDYLTQTLPPAPISDEDVKQRFRGQAMEMLCDAYMLLRAEPIHHGEHASLLNHQGQKIFGMTWIQESQLARLPPDYPLDLSPEEAKHVSFSCDRARVLLARAWVRLVYANGKKACARLVRAGNEVFGAVEFESSCLFAYKGFYELCGKEGWGLPFASGFFGFEAGFGKAGE